jgi:hypothetical protein
MKRGATLVVLAAALALAGDAQAATVRNAGFERPDLRGWQQFADPDAGCGSWATYGGAGLPGLPPPPQGKRAVAALAPGECLGEALILSQAVRLKRGRRHELSFRLAYSNSHDRFFVPRTFAPEPAANQQVRVDVLKARAPLRSFNPAHILKRVYLTRPGAPLQRGYHRVTAKLTRFAGKRVRLRFAVVANRGPLAFGLDAVRVKSTRKR